MSHQLHRPRFTVAAATAMGLLLLAATTLPAAAMTVRGEGSYSRFHWGAEGGGIFIIDKNGNSHSRVNALLVGLVGSQEYFVDGRSIGCNGTPAPGNREFDFRRTTDTEGTLSIHAEKDQDLTVKSIWVGPSDGSGPTRCSISLNFEEIKVATGDLNGDGALGVFKVGQASAIVAVEKLSNGQARVSVVAADINGDPSEVVGSGKPCNQPATAATNYLSVGLVDVLISGYKVKTVMLSQQHLDALRSFRFRNTTEGKQVGCAPLSIIAVLIG